MLIIFSLFFCAKSFSKECRDVSLKVALSSVQKDVSLSKGSLVTLDAQPRLAAKKNIYIIGTHTVHFHRRYVESTFQIELVLTGNNMIKFYLKYLTFPIMLKQEDLKENLMRVLGQDQNTFMIQWKCLIFITCDGSRLRQ